MLAKKRVKLTVEIHEGSHGSTKTRQEIKLQIFIGGLKYKKDREESNLEILGTPFIT